MNTMNLTAAAPARFTLRQLLIIDALTCLATGALLVAASAPLAELLGLPAKLLSYAGLVLFPCAALMGAAARTRAAPLVWLVILGNFAWAAASVAVAHIYDPTRVGMVFVLAQAVVVAALGILEFRARR